MSKIYPTNNIVSRTRHNTMSLVCGGWRFRIIECCSLSKERKSKMYSQCLTESEKQSSGTPDLLVGDGPWMVRGPTLFFYYTLVSHQESRKRVLTEDCKDWCKVTGFVRTTVTPSFQIRKYSYLSGDYNPYYYVTSLNDLM